MERKSSVKEVHRYINQDYPELYKTLCSRLGESNPFAKFNIGAGIYVWSDNRCEWFRMIDASEFKQSIIHDALYQVKESVAGIVGSKTAEALFTTPDDSYIYYNDDSDDIKILITGWGFKKPVRIITDKEEISITQKNPITISFLYDGERLTDYEFGLRLGHHVKRLNTDSNGLFVFDNLKVGEKFTVTDIQSNQDFSLEIKEGQSTYIFDVTKYSPLDISAVCDGQPVTGETVDVSYHDKKYEATTDGNGHATIQLPLYDGETATASMRDKNESTSMTEAGGFIEFNFEPEKKPVDIQISVMKDSEMVPSQPVTISYGGKTIDGITDSNGIFCYQMEEIPNELCTVSTSGYESQTKKLDNNALNTFVFETTTAPTPKDYFYPHILVKRENGDIVVNYPISVEYNGTVTDYITNSEGIVVLSEMEDGKTIRVSDGFDSNHVTDYTLDKGQIEYVFVIPDEEARDIKVMFRNLKGEPIVCNNVTFRQEKKPELTLQLNENGDTYFKEGTFDLGTPVFAQINGWSNTEQYYPIPFTLEKDEYEYLLQEEEAKTTFKSKWWKILLEILAILAAIASLLLLWPLFESFCQTMFGLIY